jgi:hypothetical protein
VVVVEALVFLVEVALLVVMGEAVVVFLEEAMPAVVVANPAKIRLK